MAKPNPNIPLSASLDTTVTSYEIPLSAIALWPTPNYEHSERRFGLAPFSFFLQCLTTVILAGRIWARITRRAGTFGGDDVLIILAWVFGTAFTAVSIWGVVDGEFSRHIWDIPQTLVAQGAFVSTPLPSQRLREHSLIVKRLRGRQKDSSLPRPASPKSPSSCSTAVLSIAPTASASRELSTASLRSPSRTSSPFY